jgi:ribonuclease P protein component
VSASRKVGNAIVRNRAKRLVREAFRATRDLWPPGFDVVVIVRRPLEDGLSSVVGEWLAAGRSIRRRLSELSR